MKQTIVFLGITVASGLLLGTAGCSKKEPQTQAKAATENSTRSVQISAAQKQFLAIEAAGAAQAREVLSLPGRVTFRPQAQFAVGAAVTGRVSAVLVRAGEVVKAGAPLLTIDSADAAAARAANNQASTRLAAAENAFRRQVEMVERGVGLELERHEAEARLKEARAELERARSAVGLLGPGQGNRFTVRAPGEGVVMAIRASVGATVAPGGEALVELGDPKRLQVVAQVPESDLRRIAVGQEAEVLLPALALRMAARVENVSPRVDPESRRMQLFLGLISQPGLPADAAAGLRAGMLAQVTVRAAAESDLLVPVSAVLIKDGRRRVVYVERADGAFEPREVQTGRNRDGHVVILQGLKAGERIVVRGALLLDSQAEQLL